MTKTFDCPSCGAPLRHLGTATQVCTYCENTVIVPREQQAKPPVWPVRLAGKVSPAVMRRYGSQHENRSLVMIAAIFTLLIFLLFVGPLLFIILLVFF
jgi:uncharacterized Zn finger protein (UPF0148 family)